MATIVIQIDPRTLNNPSADLRYVVPDLLSERTSGQLADDGYDYVGDPASPHLLLFLRTDDPDAAVSRVIEVMASETVLGNDLSTVPVAVLDNRGFHVVHPPGYTGWFPQPESQ